jgi:hypothetical protein
MIGDHPLPCLSALATSGLVAVLLQSCAIVSYMETDMRALRAGATRADIERDLGAPLSTTELPSGATASYRVRRGFDAVKCPRGDALAAGTMGILAAPFICASSAIVEVHYGADGKVASYKYVKFE